MIRPFLRGSPRPPYTFSGLVNITPPASVWPMMIFDSLSIGGPAGFDLVARAGGLIKKRWRVLAYDSTGYFGVYNVTDSLTTFLLGPTGSLILAGAVTATARKIGTVVYHLLQNKVLPGFPGSF